MAVLQRWVWPSLGNRPQQCLAGLPVSDIKTFLLIFASSNTLSPVLDSSSCAVPGTRTTPNTRNNTFNNPQGRFGSWWFCALLSVSVSRSGCVGFVSRTRLCAWCWRDLKYRTSNEETKVGWNKVLREYVTEHKPLWWQLVIRHYLGNSEPEAEGRGGGDHWLLQKGAGISVGF